MKFSKYNLLRKINDKFYVINILNATFLEVTEEQYRQLENGKLEDTSIVDKLYDSGMIVDEDFDELEFLRERYRTAQGKKDLLTITIAPTLRCNFGCPYCYENRNGKIIDQEAQDKIIEFIEKQLSLGYKDFNMIWFGGEPLMAYPIIRDMSKRIIEICDRMNVNYNAFMTTNGYLLNDQIIDELESLRVNQLYITLDGLAEVHDTRRHLLDGGATFDRIVENLFKLKNKGVNTVIRMNVDRTNVDAIEPLRDFVTNELQLPMYLGLVRQYTDCCSDEDIYFTKEEYSRLLDAFDENLSRDRYVEHKLPRQLPIYCRACKVGTFVIDPDLNLFKCENDIGREDKRIATIEDYPYEDELCGVNNMAYYRWDPFKFEKCTECEILPICTGGCPYVGIKQNDAECEIHKYNVDNTVKKYILQIDSKSSN